MVTTAEDGTQLSAPAAGEAAAGHPATPERADARTAAVDEHRSGMSALFGRSLLYVVVWSLQLLITSFSSPVLAYILGPGQFGLIATAIAIYQVLLVFAVFGFDQVTLLIYSDPARGRPRAMEFLSFAAVFAVVVTAVIFATGPLWVRMLGTAHFSGIIAIAVLWTAPSAISLLILAILRADDRLGPFCVVSILSAVGGQVIGVSLLLGYERSSTVYAWAGVLAQVSAMLVGLCFVRPSLRGLLDLPGARAAMRLGFPLMTGSLAVFVLNAGDRVVVLRYLGDAAVGRYQIAYTVGSTVVLLLTFVNESWLPRVLAIQNQDARWRLIEESRDLLIRVIAPVFLGLVIIAPIVLRFVAPSAYRTSTLLSVVLLVAASAFPVADASASGRALLALRRTSAVALSAAIAAVSNIALNLVLVPHLQINGSALATVLSFTIQAAVARVFLRGKVPVSAPSRALLTTVALAIGLAVLTTLVPADGVWIAARIAFGVVCAAAVYLVVIHAGHRAGSHRLA